MVKQLSSFAVLNINGGDRVSYTYDEIDETTGDPISLNNKGSFFVVNDDLKKNIEGIRKYIREEKLEG